MADFTLRQDGLRWHFEVPTDTGVVQGWRPTSGWARRAARRHVRPPTVPCPNCGEGIDRMARRCQFCGVAVPDVGSPRPLDPPAPTTATDAPTTAPAARPAPPKTVATEEADPKPKAGPKPRAVESVTLSRLTWIGLLVAGSAAAIAVVAIVIYAVVQSEPRSPQARSHSTTTGSMLPSAEGKPCVSVADPLPPDALDFPDVTGPAPTERQVVDVDEGDGETVAETDTVTINYVIVACSTGKVVGSSYAAGRPLTVPVGSIDTISDNVVGMRVGGERVIGVPSGELTSPVGRPDVIAPDDAVWYAVEVTATSR